MSRRSTLPICAPGLHGLEVNEKGYTTVTGPSLGAANVPWASTCRMHDSVTGERSVRLLQRNDQLAEQALELHRLEQRLG